MDDEKRSARATERRRQRTENKARGEAWKAIVDEYFGFLRTDYQFRIAGVNISAWGKQVTYKSPVLAIHVNNASLEYYRVELEFFRLVVGEESWALGNRFYHDSLLKDRVPEIATHLDALKGLSDENVRASLLLLAQAVKEHATDLLSGDLSYFDTLKLKP